MRRNVLISYCRAGLLLHTITLFEILIITSILYITGFETPDHLLSAFGFLFLFSLPVLAQLDAWSRFQNYKQAKDQINHFGFQKRIFAPFQKSRCQRDAVFTAARELGYANECRDFFVSKGYKWYHLLPDIVLKDPRKILTYSFFKTTFFAAYYRPRYNPPKENKKIPGRETSVSVPGISRKSLERSLLIQHQGHHQH
ncbi:MAG: hypothetical protein C5B52_19180 [Bacteroidetes bacterium]|nr:MAG: hypothetical protein C5B52_19180 [Bacteroidota bacterium]